MSLNIPTDMLKVSDCVILRVDTEKLGPRQIVAFKRQVKTGVMMNGALPARVAASYRESLGLPYFMVGQYSRISWGNVPEEHPMFEVLHAACVAVRLQGEANKWQRQYMDRAEKTVARKESYARDLFFARDFCKVMAKMSKQIEFPLYEGEVPRFIETKLHGG